MENYITKKQKKELIYCPIENYLNTIEQKKIQQQNDLKDIIKLDDKIKELQNIIDSVRKKYPFLKDLTINDIKLLINN